MTPQQICLANGIRPTKTGITDIQRTRLPPEYQPQTELFTYAQLFRGQEAEYNFEFYRTVVGDVDKDIELASITVRELVRRAMWPRVRGFERFLQAHDPIEVVEWLQGLSDDELMTTWRDQHRIEIQHLMAREAVKEAIKYQSIHPLEGRAGTWETLGQL